jgi:hypothetical protein
MASRESVTRRLRRIRKSEERKARLFHCQCALCGLVLTTRTKPGLQAVLTSHYAEAHPEIAATGGAPVLDDVPSIHHGELPHVPTPPAPSPQAILHAREHLGPAERVAGWFRKLLRGESVDPGGRPDDAGGLDAPRPGRRRRLKVDAHDRVLGARHRSR